MKETNRKIVPDTPTDHIIKQRIYGSYLKEGSSVDAKRTFLRPPFYMTAAEVSDVHREEEEGIDSYE